MSRLIASVRLIFRSLFRRKSVEEELDEELRYHLEQQIQEELSGGLTPEEARYAAMRAMGPIAKSMEECRDADRVQLLDDLVRDLNYAARTLRRNPAFAAVVLTTLAIAIGAVVTVFSIVDAWLLKPLNFPQPDRLAIAFAARPERPMEPAVWLPYREYLAWQERSHSFQSLAAAFVRDVTLTMPAEGRTLLGLNVTPEFFSTFGVGAFLGRALSREDVQGPQAVVLSYGLWQRQFGGNRDVVGTRIILSSVPYLIVGVMPRDFETRVLDMRFELWTLLRPGEDGYVPGGFGPVSVIGRLRNGISIEKARSELAAITRETESAYPNNFNRFVVNLTSLQADNTRTIRLTLWTVSAAVASLLLIASMNVGTLLLGRGLIRLREAAIRTAIGSGRVRLIRQFLTESLMITGLGGIAGLGLAAVAIRLFVGWNPLGVLPANVIRLDLRVLGAAIVAMAVTTVLCGLIPALLMSNTDPYNVLRAGGERGATTLPGHRLQATLLATQMAACVILLVSTTLLIRTFIRLQSEPMGFDPNNLAVANVVLPDDAFDSSEKRNLFYTELAERIRARPGVRAVAAGSSQPLSSGAPSTVNTTAEDSVDAPRISTQEVTIEFFDTLAIRMRAGRAFDARDKQNAMPVVILNMYAAQALFGSPAGALGQRLRLDNEPWREVVGVVDNVRSTFFNTLEWKTDPIVYRPAAQGFNRLSNPTATSFGFKLYIRGERPLTMADLRTTTAAISPHAAITDLRTAREIVNEATRQPEFRMKLLVSFAVVSLFLAAIGIYGLVSQAVVERRRELAIRLALGARPSGVIASVTRSALTVTMIGFAAGMIAALGLGHAWEALLYGVQPRDAISFAAAGSILLLAAATAAFLPALRAARVDPAKVLRAD